jgi:hypothetical protein
MKSISTTRVAKAAIAIGFLSALSLASSPAWSQSLIGDGLSASQDPNSPYYHSEVAPPSWQDRPHVVPGGTDWQKRQH